MPRVARSLGSLLVVALGVVALASCSSSSNGGGPPPLFNAVDNSVTCPAGQVGWDFSTGGADGLPPKLPDDLHIMSAGLYDGTYPESTYVYEDLTSTVTTQCEGNKTCDVPFPSLPPKVGNTGYATVVQYSCGGAARTAIAYPGTDKDIHVQCGTIISVLDAQVTCGSGGKALADVTSHVAKEVAGKDSVAANQNIQASEEFYWYYGNCYGCGRPQCTAAGDDPIAGAIVTVTYTCGTDPTKRVASTSPSNLDDSPLTFSCPAQPDPAPLPGLIVTSATYGANCGVPSGNWTDTFQQSCDGKRSCSRQTRVTGDPPGDPAPNCPKNLAVTYQCGDTNDTLVVVPGEAAGAQVNLACGQAIHIQDASWGANANPALKGNFTSQAVAKCDDTVRCQPGADPTQQSIATSTALFGSDPAPNQVKQWVFDYTCGSDPTVLTKTFQQNDVIDFQCPVLTPPTPAAWAIHVTNEIQPGTDTNADLLAGLEQQCFGKSVCNVKYDPGSNPKYFSNAPLQVTWVCGDDQTTHTTTIPAPAKGQDLSAITCAPPIDVVSARYGENCPANAGTSDDRTAAIENACSGRSGTCSYVLQGLGDPHPFCAKDFDVVYTCGVDPTQRTAHVAGEAAGKTLALTCPTDPSGLKSCVPASCTGYGRRNAELNCVPDNSLPVLPPIQSWSAQLTPHNSPANSASPPTVLKGQPVDLTINVQLETSVPQELPGQQAAKATVWVYDTFHLNAGQSGPPTVNGVRCVLGHPGLIASAQNPSQLSSTQSNLMIPPECYPRVNYDGTPSGNMLPSWMDAARRANIDFATFQGSYTMDKQAYLAVSFDEQGETVALRKDGTTADNALVPNPVGFFYDPRRSWVDMIAYYQQTLLDSSMNHVDSNGARLASSYVPVVFDRTNTIQYIANSATLRTAEFDASPSAAPGTLRMDFGWSLYDDPQNPFSPATTDASADTSVTQSLAAVVEVTSDAAYKAAGLGQNWPGPADTMLLTPDGVVPGIHLTGGVPTGKTDELVVTVPDAVKQRVLTPNDQTLPGGGAGWYDPNNVFGKFWVRICLGAMGQDPTTHAFRRSSSWNNVTFTAKASASNNCFVAPQPLVAARSDLRVRPAPHVDPTAGAYAESGASADKGSSDTSTGSQDTGLVSGCGDATTMGPMQTDCSDRTTSTSGSSAAGGGTGSHSLFQTTSDSTVKKDGSGETHGTGELEGFQVFDADTTMEASDKDPAWDHEVKLAPDWAGIKEAFDSSEEANPEPVKPEMETETFHAGERGLGIGVGISKQLTVGPIPVKVELSVSVGVGVELILRYDNPAAYPCIGGSTTCFQAYSDAQSQDEANTNCALKGGQLAQILTASDWNAVEALKTSGTYWIGAQQSYLYASAACKTNPASGNCAAGARTYYEWLYATDPTNSVLPLTFAEQIGSNAQILDPSTEQTLTMDGAFGGPLSALNGLTTSVPDPGAVALSGTQLTTDKIDAKHPYVCGFAPGGSSSQANKSAVEITVGTSAGVNLQACVPSDVVGACVGLGLSFIQGEFGFQFANMETLVTDPTTNMLKQASGRRSQDITWKIGILQGEMSASINLLFTSISWTVFEFGPTPFGPYPIYQNEGEPYLQKF